MQGGTFDQIDIQISEECSVAVAAPEPPYGCSRNRAHSTWLARLHLGMEVSDQSFVGLGDDLRSGQPPVTAAKAMNGMVFDETLFRPKFAAANVRLRS
jgi:hypothetical protein